MALEHYIHRFTRWKCCTKRSLTYINFFVDPGACHNVEKCPFWILSAVVCCSVVVGLLNCIIMTLGRHVSDQRHYYLVKVH